MNARPTSSVIVRASWLTRATRSGERVAGMLGPDGRAARRVRPRGGARRGFGELAAESTTQLGDVPVEDVEIAPRQLAGAPRRRGLAAARQRAQAAVQARERDASRGA